MDIDACSKIKKASFEISVFLDFNWKLFWFNTTFYAEKCGKFLKHEWNALDILYNLNHSSKWILTLVDACGKIKKHCKMIYFRFSNITRGPNPRGETIAASRFGPPGRPNPLAAMGRDPGGPYPRWTKSAGTPESLYTIISKELLTITGKH